MSGFDFVKLFRSQKFLQNRQTASHNLTTSVSIYWSNCLSHWNESAGTMKFWERKNSLKKTSEQTLIKHVSTCSLTMWLPYVMTLPDQNIFIFCQWVFSFSFSSQLLWVDRRAAVKFYLDLVPLLLIHLHHIYGSNTRLIQLLHKYTYNMCCLTVAFLLCLCDHVSQEEAQLSLMFSMLHVIYWHNKKIIKRMSLP